MKIPTFDECVAMLEERGWVVHDEPGRLNILILRRVPGRLDAFDDMLVVFGRTAAGERLLFACRCTADPGKPSRAKPRRRDGTAVWAVGQVVDGLRMGLHHGVYPCLVPVTSIPVLRYTSIDDPEGTPSRSATVQIHRANSVKESKVVGPWSEGCVVVANPDDYDDLLQLWRDQVAAGWDYFTVSCVERAA